MLRTRMPEVFPYEEGEPLFEVDGWRWAFAGRLGKVAVVSYQLALLEVSTGNRREMAVDTREMILIDHQTKTMTRYATDPNFFAALREFEETGVFRPGSFEFGQPSPNTPKTHQ